MTTILSDFFAKVIAKLKIVPNLDKNDDDDGNKKLLFTIQYTKEELDKIQNDFLEQLSSYFAKVNNNNSNRNKEVELFPPTNSN
jgi:hypothetical protein